VCVCVCVRACVRGACVRVCVCVQSQFSTDWLGGAGALLNTNNHRGGFYLRSLT